MGCCLCTAHRHLTEAGVQIRGIEIRIALPEERRFTHVVARREWVRIPTRLILAPCSGPSRCGLATLARQARQARRPTLTVPACGAPLHPQAGTKERLPGTNKGTAQSQEAIDDVINTLTRRVLREDKTTMENRSSRRVRTLVTRTARRGLSANEIACALISMMARSTCSNQRPNTLTQDRISQRPPKPLAPHGRTIHWVIRVILTVGQPLPIYPR